MQCARALHNDQERTEAFFEMVLLCNAFVCQAMFFRLVGLLQCPVQWPEESQSKHHDMGNTQG
jgi:hypothetical protein